MGNNSFNIAGDGVQFRNSSWEQTGVQSRSLQAPFPLSRVEVDSMIQAALARLSISATCNDDGTITVTLNGK